MYRDKYYKYKNKYINLKRHIRGGTYLVTAPQVERESEFIELDELAKIAEPYDVSPFYLEDVEYLTVESPDEDEKDTIEDINRFGLGRAEEVNSYNFDRDDFISLEDEPSRDKILAIDTLDDFDNFTEKYGGVKRFRDIDPEYGKQDILYIRWDRVSKEYRGIYINPGLAEDRKTEAYYKGGIYRSWWGDDFMFEDEAKEEVDEEIDQDIDEEDDEDIEEQPKVLIFKKIPEKPFRGKPIVKPFKGRMFSFNDFPENYYTEFHSDKKNKIVKLDTYDSFDDFTTEYGDIKVGNRISIKWDDVKTKYSGVYIDKDAVELYKTRYNKAFFEGEKYNSWLKGEGIKRGVVYLFTK